MAKKVKAENFASIKTNSIAQEDKDKFTTYPYEVISKVVFGDGPILRHVATLSDEAGLQSYVDTIASSNTYNFTLLGNGVVEIKVYFQGDVNNVRIYIFCVPSSILSNGTEINNAISGAVALLGDFGDVVNFFDTLT